MFFLSRAVLKLLRRNICFYTLFLIRDNKNTVPDTYYINSGYPNVIKFMEITKNSAVTRKRHLELITNQAKNVKTSFPKDQAENADFYKPLLSQIITTHE